MDTTEKLKPVRVKLQEWLAKDEILTLKFEKVATYISSIDFSKKGFPVDVFTNFGKLEITLTGCNKEDRSWLNEYLDNDNLYIEEEIENHLTFWDGEYEDGYDWSSSYSIPFKEKVIKEYPLTAEEWKEKYVDMTLKWEKIFYERYHILERDFLKLFIEVVKGHLKTIMPERNSEELETFKKMQIMHMDYWLQGMEDRIADLEKAYAGNSLPSKTPEEIQTEINKDLKNFWQRLVEKFR